MALKIGNKDIVNVMLGDTQVVRVMRGSDEVWSFGDDYITETITVSPGDFNSSFTFDFVPYGGETILDRYLSNDYLEHLTISGWLSNGVPTDQMIFYSYDYNKECYDLTHVYAGALAEFYNTKINSLGAGAQKTISSSYPVNIIFKTVVNDDKTYVNAVASGAEADKLNFAFENNRLKVTRNATILNDITVTVYFEE